MTYLGKIQPENMYSVLFETPKSLYQMWTQAGKDATWINRETGSLKTLLSIWTHNKYFSSSTAPVLPGTLNNLAHERTKCNVVLRSCFPAREKHEITSIYLSEYLSSASNQIGELWATDVLCSRCEVTLDLSLWSLMILDCHKYKIGRTLFQFLIWSVTNF